jgi:hypothetical protein
MHDLDCEVQMWAEEWNERPDARTCRDAVQRVASPPTSVDGSMRG